MFMYFQLIFLFNLEETERLVGISVDINLLSTDVPCETKWNLKIGSDFNWYQSAFNWCSFWNRVVQMIGPILFFP